MIIIIALTGGMLIVTLGLILMQRGLEPLRRMTAKTRDITASRLGDRLGIEDTPAELRELADDELTTKLRECKEELFNLRFQTATGQLTNNHRLRTVRQEIARIYTVLRERELGLATGPGGEDS